MKRLLLVGLVLLLAVGLVSAGERMTKQGTHSLNFYINGLGNFGVFGVPAGTANGSYLYGFGGSYFLQDDMALRAGVAFNRWHSSEKDYAVAGDERNLTEFDFGIMPALLWYCMSEGPVAGYWGPTAFYGMSSDETEYIPPAGASTTTKVSYTDFGFGVVMGAQWWAWDQVAFNAEYILAYTMSSSKVESGATSTDGPDITDFGIYSWSVGLGLFFNR